MTDPPSTSSIEEADLYVALTHELLDIASVVERVKRRAAGAVVLFAGTTRDNFGGKAVVELQYSAYGPMALRSMATIAREVKTAHELNAIAIVHRLGTVPIGEESILIAVSAPHRHAAWKGGEEALERCKESVEIWKREEFGGAEGGVWRANRDGALGVPVAKTEGEGGG